MLICLHICVFNLKHFAGHFIARFSDQYVEMIKYVCTNMHLRLHVSIDLHTYIQHYEPMASWKPHASSSETWKLSAHRGGLSKVVQLPVRPWLSSESM